MQQIKQFFKNIGREDLDENSQNLLSSGLIDSLDIMAFIAEVQKHYKKPFLLGGGVEPNDFENFENIKKLIERVML
ncbi:acyl carrier protein [Campylobacter upsaliensis]|nr:acyl carrier protein [Campylobacter upsaliensis]